MEMSFVYIIFIHKPEYWKNWDFDLMVELNDKSAESLQFILMRNTTVCTRFHGNPSISRWDIKHKTTSVSLMWNKRKSHGLTEVIRIHHLKNLIFVNAEADAGGSEGKVRGSSKSAGFILSGTWMSWMSWMSFVAIHPVTVELFQCGPKQPVAWLIKNKWWSTPCSIQWHSYTLAPKDGLLENHLENPVIQKAIYLRSADIDFSNDPYIKGTCFSITILNSLRLDKRWGLAFHLTLIP